MIHTCALLHNFVITEKVKTNGRIATRRSLRDDCHAITQHCEAQQEKIYDPSWFEKSDGVSGADHRQNMMDIIEKSNIRRPQRNSIRNG